MNIVAGPAANTWGWLLSVVFIVCVSNRRLGLLRLDRMIKSDMASRLQHPWPSWQVVCPLLAGFITQLQFSGVPSMDLWRLG